jgi:tetratricopeptide (TPR) repeat protein/uncharacterized membrane protein
MRSADTLRRSIALFSGSHHSSEISSALEGRPTVFLDVLAATAAAVVALVTYWGATGYYFSQDDFVFLARATGELSHPGLLERFGNRIVSTRLYFQMMNSVFGLEPRPYHWASLGLHALNAVLVYALARCWARSRLVATVAALLFAALDLSFTAVYWISGIQDLLATCFMLVAALIWVAGIHKGWPAAALSAAALGLSLLSKETGLLLPGALFLLTWASGRWSRRMLVMLTPHLAIAASAVVLLIVQNSGGGGTEAYGIGVTFGLVHNLATYIAWTAEVLRPFKDRLAMIDYRAWKTALPAVSLLCVLLLTSRGKPRRMYLAALGWYVLMIAPVLPLLQHTYLYYLYPAAPGVALLAGVAAQRLTLGLSSKFHSSGAPIGWALSIGLTAAICAAGIANVRTREHTYLREDYKLPYDHVIRSAVLAENAVEGLRSTRLPPGADLLFINPYGGERVDLAQGTDPEAERRTYDMFRAALRDGDVLRLLKPDLGKIEFAKIMEPQWENSHAFLYDGFGRLEYLGTGADTWANLSTVHLYRTKQLEKSMRCSGRALDLRPAHPVANLNMGIALARTGSVDEAREHLMKAARMAPNDAIRNDALEWLRRTGGGP